VDAYLELLKETYYKERKKLYAMPVFNQNGKIRFLLFKKEALNKARDNLSISQMLGRGDITEEVKENLLKDRDKAEAIEKYLDKNFDSEMAEIEDEIAAEIKNSRCSSEEYAQYVLQLEKVNALEAELETNRLFPEMVYEEQKAIIEDKNKTGGGE